jgi:inner membrane protein
LDPITHALASAALSRAGLNRMTRLATPMALVAGLAADIDALSLADGAGSYLEYNRTLTHSLAGSSALAALVAAAFWLIGRKHAVSPIRFVPAFAVTAAAAACHLLLDLAESYGLALLWPFQKKWTAWDLVDAVDPWILLVLVAGWLLPGLFRLVTEEIGARPAARGKQRAAVLALALVALYCGGRALLHERARDVLGSRLYHGAPPVTVGAFPGAASPLEWRGVVATENTLEEIHLSLAPGSFFNPDRSSTHFKHDPSPALQAALGTVTIRRFLQFARFPAATVEPARPAGGRLMDGYRVTVRDLRFPEKRRIGRNVVAVVELDSEARVRSEQFQFATAAAKP